MADETYNDRTIGEPNDKALPGPQIEIIVDGNSVFKPSMKTYFVDDYDPAVEEIPVQVMGEYCSCDTVVSTHTVCTCDTVCTCEAVCSCEMVCTCEDVCSCDGHTTCSCVADTGSSGGGYVSCGAPCACVPVH